MNGAGKLAVVTGASSGIGEAYARRLARDGFDLVLVARRKQLLLDIAMQLSETHRVSVSVEPADLSRDADVDRLFDLVRSSSSLEMLINNAGFTTHEKYIDADIESQVDMVRVHDIATLRLTRGALDVMRNRGRGTIINVSSMAGILPSPYNANYNATKAYLVSLTEGIVQELALAGIKGIRVQALCPGYTHTGFHDAAGVAREGVPERVWMSAEDVVEESFACLEKGRVVCVPGAKNRLLASMVSAMPRRIRYVLLRTVERED
ncbi:MAG TPA: SDR family oxidoreductase [Candidatus Anoxymicrobiaceae bacterium]|jgi:uncharacterized protein